LALAFIALSIPTAWSQASDEISQFRFLSLALRDHVPSLEEAMEFHNGEKTLDQFLELWFASPAHQKRIARYFNDKFGMDKYFFISPETHDLILSRYGLINGTPTWSEDIPADLQAQNLNNVYYLPNFTKSTCGNVVSANAWWSDTPIQICESAVTDDSLDVSIFAIGASDRYLDFHDGQSSRSAQIPLASYTRAGLAEAMEDAMNATGSSDLFTVSWSDSQDRFTIASDGVSLSLLFSSGPNAANTIGDKISFWTGGDYTGSLAYTGWSLYPNVRCSNTGSQGMAHPDCGCGKEQFLCYPLNDKGKVINAVGLEFQNRALFAYNQNRPWLDVFGGDLFYGNRWLYHHYLYQQDFTWSSRTPPPAVLASIKAMPLDSMSLVPMPSHSYSDSSANGVERAGVVTAPGFLRRFNNFRSRIRALTERLLCKDVDATLNIDGYDTFNNPNFGPGSPVRAHGEKAACASCHYSLDNFGATIIMWGDGSDGFFSPWAYGQRSQLGHVFGEDGTGPRFLIEQYLAQNEFRECMAKSLWEDFSGRPFSTLAADVRATFIAAANDGPKSTIQAILGSAEFRLTRYSQPVVSTTNVATEYSFASDVAPILAAKCGPCHSGAGGQTRYVDNEANFKSAPANRIMDGTMPPPGGSPLTSAEANILYHFLQQE
jgi:hypothetical protein